MTKEIHPLLLCGGLGTRLWPLSRKSFPKQFTKLTGEESLFQVSARRLSGPGFAAPSVITATDYRFIVAEQLAGIELAAAATLIEPAGRNTAPAILAGALELCGRSSGALMLVAPSDHVIPEAAAFRAAVQEAIPAAKAGQLVTFGIRPDRAETGYGWLELSKIPEADFRPVQQSLKSFVEKPDAVTAQGMLDGGTHLWNAGIFLFSTDAILAAFEAHQPEMLRLVREAVAASEKDLGFVRLAPEPWADCADLSIDYAVMEKVDNLTVVPYGGTWSDLGGWDAVWRESEADERGVVTSGPVTAIDCTGSLLRAEDAQQVVVGIGLAGPRCHNDHQRSAEFRVSRSPRPGSVGARLRWNSYPFHCSRIQRHTCGNGHGRVYANAQVPGLRQAGGKGWENAQPAGCHLLHTHAADGVTYRH